MNLVDKTDAELKNIIANHEGRRLWDASLYLAAKSMWEARHGAGFNFERSMEVIRDAARKRRFLSYKDVADASGLEWKKVRYQVGAHLDRLCRYAFGKGWPLLTAIIVNRNNIATGALDPTALEGFIRIAEELNGITYSDRDSFLRTEQDRVFRWAETIA